LISAVYFLSVVYVADHKESPFLADALSMQVILVRDPQRTESRLNDPTAFMVFDPAADYKLEYSTTTSWDAADPELTAGLQPYFVPTACIECHNHEFAAATPQFIDTDYLLDKASPGEDFADSVGSSRFGALFEGGKDLKSKQFHDAFDVVRKLNAEILQHNEAVNPDALSARGARNWMRLHEQSDAHFPPIERGWPSGGKEWRKENPLHGELAPLLTRYCYRCHGTIHYNVFNKHDRLEGGEGVEDWLELMIENVETGRMPMDRTLSRAARDGLSERLKKLQKEISPPAE
jgi:hypothetical protein